MSTNEVFIIPDNRVGQNSFDPNLLLASMMNGNNGLDVMENRKLCDFAISKMSSTNPSTGEVVHVVKLDKEAVDAFLKTYRIKIKNNQLYDYVYVANMCKADFLGRSVPDEQHLCLYVKDVIDDVDGYDGLVFNRWYADMCRTGIAIDWEEML